MKSIFKAKIYHKRFNPTVNEFSNEGYYIKFSLDKLEQLKSRFFSVNKFNLFSFYEKDHGFRDGSSLEHWGRGMLLKAGISNFKGHFELQTFPRVLGYVFNPVSFWFAYEKNELVAIICEVNNTFSESHNYVITQKPGEQIAVLQKEFHVSPFYPVEGSYQFNFKSNNKININYFSNDRLQLITSIEGREINWTDKNLLKLFFRYPFFTFLVVFHIHLQALKLFWKKNKFYSKPNKISKELTHD